MPKTLAAWIVILLVAAACGGGRSAGVPSPSPSPQVGGLTRGLVAYIGSSGVGVLDPASGKSSIVAPLPAGGAFRVSGVAWGPAPGLDYPVVYFTVHDDRPAESRDSAGVIPYDWLFRVDEFTGEIAPVAAYQDSFSEGPIGLFANGHYLAMTVGCCASYEVDVLDLNRPAAGLRTLAKPTDPVTFFTEGIAPAASGLIAVRAFSTGAWYWLNADAGVLNPFPLKLGTDDGPIAVSPDGTTAAIALPDKGALIEPINVAVPLASPTPTPGVSPVPSPSTKQPSPHASPSAPAAPRYLNSHLPHPDSIAWSPDGKQIMLAVSSELELFNANAPDGTAAQGRFFINGGIIGVAWSGSIPGKTLSRIKKSAGPQGAVDALIAATALPTAADTPDKRPFTKVYLWQFDSSKPSPIATITDATPAVLAKYPPLDAGVVIHHWAPLDSWELIGGCFRYRVVITGSIAPVAATVGLNGSAPCLAPSPTPTPTPTSKPTHS